MAAIVQDNLQGGPRGFFRKGWAMSLGQLTVEGQHADRASTAHHKAFSTSTRAHPDIRRDATGNEWKAQHGGPRLA